MQPPDMKGSCEYIDLAVADSRQMVVLQLGKLDVGLTTYRLIKGFLNKVMNLNVLLNVAKLLSS
jgi:hypothetical protein